MEYYQNKNPFEVDQIQLREDIAAALRKHPKSMHEISKDTGLDYITMKKFANGEYISNKTALRLQKYIDGLMEQK